MMITLRWDTHGLEHTMNALRWLGAKLPEFRAGLSRKMATAVQALAKANVDGQALKVRSGDLKRLVSRQPVETVDSGASWGLPAGNPVSVYGAKQNAGGPIRSASGKLLRIPLPPALDSRGVDIYKGIAFREFPPPGRWFVLRRNNRLTLCVAETRNKKYSKITPMYSLVREVNIPATGWFGWAVNDTDFRGIIATELDRLRAAASTGRGGKIP